MENRKDKLLSGIRGNNMSDMTKERAAEILSSIADIEDIQTAFKMGARALRQIIDIEDAIHYSPNAADEILYIIDHDTTY